AWSRSTRSRWWTERRKRDDPDSGITLCECVYLLMRRSGVRRTFALRVQAPNFLPSPPVCLPRLHAFGLEHGDGGGRRHPPDQIADGFEVRRLRRRRGGENDVGLDLRRQRADQL